MRPLVFVCEEKDVDDLNQAISQFIHPQIPAGFVSIVVVNLSAHNLITEKYKVTDACRVCPNGSTNTPMVHGTKEVSHALNLETLLSTFNIKHKRHARSMLCATHRPQPIIQGILSDCGLTVKAAATEMLSGWAHQQIDTKSIERWAEQFNRFGKLTWLSQLILSNVRYVSQTQLGDLLCSSLARDDSALSVNHDLRTHGKSGDVLANLLNKRMQGKRIYENPADAIEDGHSKIIMFEDGLFTGTETVGVLESILGERASDRQKSRPLSDPTKFPLVEFTLYYGIGTDYGKSIVDRFLKERNITNVNVKCSESVLVAANGTLDNIASGIWKINELWENGPPNNAINPHFLSSEKISKEQLIFARKFCTEIGHQLFFNYLQEMKKRKPGFRDWAPEKLGKCSLGMWGLGLTVAFGHSIPKASLPLLWGTGPITFEGKRLDSWVPLFENSW